MKLLILFWIHLYIMNISKNNYYSYFCFLIFKIFYGNRDSDTVVYNTLKPPITAHFIRILPLEWHNHISLRIEVYGCPGIPKYFQTVITVTRNLHIKSLVNLPSPHQHSAASFFSFKHQSLLGQKFKLCMVKIMWHLNKQACHITRNNVRAPLAMLLIN